MDIIKNIKDLFIKKGQKDYPYKELQTKKPEFDMYWINAGIRQPDILPSLPVLLFIHNNSPAIKIATLRLRETIFRRGFEWKSKFECKCPACGKEFTDKEVDYCDECKAKTVRPDKSELQRADKFFKKVNINNQNLLHLLKQVEDDVNVFDDAYIVGIKEYVQDDEGKIVFESLKEMVRGNPITMRIVANENGELGGKYWTCLHHRDQIEEDSKARCKKCGRKLHEVHYVSVKGGGESPTTYYIDGEVIHFSKYAPSALYGFSPIVTLWEHALTLNHMQKYIYQSYSVQHLPKGVLAVKTSNPESAFKFWRDIDDKLQKDPHYIPKMFIEGDGDGVGMEFVRFMDTLEEMQYIPVRDEIRRTIAAIYGITGIFINDQAGVGGLNAEGEQIEITTMAAESAMRVYNDVVLPEICRWLRVTDWDYKVNSPKEEDKRKELDEEMREVQIASQMLNMGFNVEYTSEGEFKFSGKAQNPQQQMFGGMGEQPPQLPPAQEQPKPKEIKQSDDGKEVAGIYIQGNDIKKGEKVYINVPQDAPEGVKVQRGSRGGLYYETEEIKSTNHLNKDSLQNIKQKLLELRQNDPNFKFTLTNKKKENIELNTIRDENNQEIIRSQTSIQGNIGKISEIAVNNKYRGQKFGEMMLNAIENGMKARGVKKIELVLPVSTSLGFWNKMGYKIDNNKKWSKILKSDDIKKFAGEKDIIQERSELQKELNKIFEQEIAKVISHTGKFSSVEMKKFTKKVVDEAVKKMKLKTDSHLKDIYSAGQEYVGKMIGKAVSFQAVDEQALKAITDHKVLWDAYSGMGKDLSKRLNNIITESYKKPKEFSLSQMVEKMKQEADVEVYKLERIVRTETAAASMAGRFNSFKKFDDGSFRYKWAIRKDARTSQICKDIDAIVEQEGQNQGVPLERLNQIIKEISQKHLGENWIYRDFTPHPNCRSGLVRIV